MMLLAGGFAVGLVAGAAARWGRLCTMSAVEDALLAHDLRAAKVWGLALGLALALTQAQVLTGTLDLSSNLHHGREIDWIAALLGGVLFGFGMALVGTCSFGLLIRAAGGDMRAMVSSVVVGVAAFSFTAGVLAPVRTAIDGLLTIDVGRDGGTLAGAWLTDAFGAGGSAVAIALLAAGLALPALTDARVQKRRRMTLAGLLVGLAVAGGWAVTAAAERMLEPARVESLSFVAPVGRLLLTVMGNAVQFADFGIGSVLGVVTGAFAVARMKDEMSWEAFDDPREMRRHLFGAVLMGLGGVLARGCTIGQGLTGASALAFTAPIVAAGVLIGARAGLALLIEGRSLWRLGPER